MQLHHPGTISIWVCLSVFFVCPLLKLWLESRCHNLIENTYWQLTTPSIFLFEVIGFHCPSGCQNRIFFMRFFFFCIKYDKWSLRSCLSNGVSTRNMVTENIFCHYFFHYFFLTFIRFLAIFCLILLVNFEFYHLVWYFLETPFRYK